MITYKMSDKEIIAEMKEDIQDVHDKFASRINVRRLILKATNFPVFSEPVEVVSRRRNKWIVIFKANKKSDHKISDLQLILVCTATFADGVHAFMITKPYPNFKGDWGLAIFYPHFFARYSKRFEVNKTGLDLRKHYFLKNHQYACDFQEETNNREPIPGRKMFGTSNEGVALGVIRSEYAVSFKTFITFEMAKGNQVDHFSWIDSHRNPMTGSFRTIHVSKAILPSFGKKNLKF